MHFFLYIFVVLAVLHMIEIYDPVNSYLPATIQTTNLYPLANDLESSFATIEK